MRKQGLLLRGQAQGRRKKEMLRLSSVVKLGSCSSLLKALNSSLSSIQKKRSRADAIIQMHPPPHNFLKLLEWWISFSCGSQTIWEISSWLFEWISKWLLRSNDTWLISYFLYLILIPMSEVLNILFLSKPTQLELDSEAAPTCIFLQMKKNIAYFCIFPVKQKFQASI